jgi:hypothetical protein
MTEAKRFFRDNLVLVAAFVLPAAVALLFMLATAIPRWTVPPPQHDLLLRAERPYATPPPDVSVEFSVTDGRVQAVVRPLARPENPNLGIPYAQRWALLLLDHATMRVREIPLDLPRTLPPDETRTVAVEALSDRRVVPGDVAPDGYKVTSLNAGGGGGIVGELFGMNRRYSHGIAVGKEGRTVELDLPSPFGDSYGVIFPIGWMQDGGGR